LILNARRKRDGNLEIEGAWWTDYFRRLQNPPKLSHYLIKDPVEIDPETAAEDRKKVEEVWNLG